MSTVQTITVPPHNLEAEKSVLGAVLLDERHLYGLLIEEHLRPEHFYREQHGEVFAAMIELHENDRKIDHLTVAETLRQRGKLEEVGGAAAIDELTGWVPAAGHARDYGRIVRDNARLRALLTTSYEIQASITSREAPARDLLERAERSVLEVAEDERQKTFRSVAEILHEETDKLHRLSIAKTSLTGTPSGFKDIDDLTGGFQPGNLIVIAARPSMGKSALVANIAENAALKGHPVALFSLEMSESELAQRFVASQARIRGEELRRGRVAENKWQKILSACQTLAEAPLWIDDSSDASVLDVRAKARRLHHQVEGGLGLIVIDYLQLMRHEGRVESRVEQVGQISRGLKGLARELNVPVIALSQLSRAVEQRGGDKKPILSDLRECVSGETLVFLADGRRVPIRDLVGTTPEVVALDERHRLVRARSDAVWHVGVRPVLKLTLASGRALRATAEHRVLAGAGWRKLSEISVGDRVAIARRIPAPNQPERWPTRRVVLLGQLIGDGSYLNNAPMRYTTASEPNSRAVTAAATREFGAKVTRYAARGSCHQLLISGNGNRWHPAGVGAWLKELGIFGQRSHEKRVPEGGTSNFSFAPSRRVLESYTRILNSEELLDVATSDVFWDRVVSIEPDGDEDVYDLTVPGPACWLADGIVTHNSGQIEADADLVMFIYREEYYDKESERPGEADIIVAKHRNGALGDIVLTFQKEYPKFMNYAGERFAA
jgi:replicative DNA helicase